jgi:hypothetical protein
MLKGAGYRTHPLKHALCDESGLKEGPQTQARCGAKSLRYTPVLPHNVWQHDVRHHALGVREFSRCVEGVRRGRDELRPVNTYVHVVVVVVVVVAVAEVVVVAAVVVAAAAVVVVVRQCMCHEVFSAGRGFAECVVCGDCERVLAKGGSRGG